MDDVITLKPREFIETKPFTDPNGISNDINTIRFMVDQLCLFMKSLPPEVVSSPPVIAHLPSREKWLYRQVIAHPESLLKPVELAFVGFMGHRQEDANLKLADEFDEILVEEIPDYPGLVSYSTMGLLSGDYSNLVVFTNPEIKKEWRKSKAHEQAVQRLAPDYYENIKLYNGRLPNGIRDSESLYLSRIKYFDYQADPRWHAVREFPRG